MGGDMSLITVVAQFGDGEHSFALRIGQWEALQELTKVSPPQLWLAIAGGDWKASWPREIIREGLIGGGMDAARAAALVRETCEDHPLLEFLPLAQAIVAKAMTRPTTAKKNQSGREAANGEAIAISSTSGPIGAAAP